MQAVRKALRKNLILSVILTIMLPLGGAMLGVGLALGQPAIWAIGIAFMVCGFYGCPCAWTMAYAPTKSLSRIVSAVVEENLCTVNEIAAQLSLSEKEVRNRLDRCFQKRYLVGYKRVGDEIVLNDNRAPAARTYSAVCPCCGASFSYTSGDTRCPYCGAPIQK